MLHPSFMLVEIIEEGSLYGISREQTTQPKEKLRNMVVELN